MTWSIDRVRRGTPFVSRSTSCSRFTVPCALMIQNIAAKTSPMTPNGTGMAQRLRIAGASFYGGSAVSNRATIQA